MSFFNRLFGGRKKPEPVMALIEDHLDYLKSLRKPALALRPTEPNTFNRIGGLPDLRWPVLNDKPFIFLCQLDLSTIPRDPKTGKHFSKKRPVRTTRRPPKTPLL